MLFTTLWIFLWKHYKSMRLTWVSALLNIGLPIGFTFLSMYLYQQATNHMPSTTDGQHQPEDQTVARHEAFGQDTLMHSYPFDHIYYTPETPESFGVMEKVRQILEIPHDQVIGFVSEAALVNRTGNQLARGEFGIVFGDRFAATQNNDNRYTIQTANGARFRTNDRLVGDFYDASMSSYDPYLYSGFLTLQLAIDRAVLAARYGDESVEGVDISFQKMPSNIRALAKYTPFGTFAIIALLMYMFSVVNMVVVPTVEEKALGIREFLRIATTHYELNLFSFYVLHVLLGGLIFGAIVAFGQVYGMTAHFSWACAMILILLYVASAIAYAFLVTVLFNTVFFAKNTGALLLIVPWTIQFYESVRFLMPLFSSTLFTAGWTLFDEYGARAQVFDMSNICEHASATIPYSMLEIWGLLAADTVVYALLYTYLVQVFPGTYGTPQPLHFPVLRLMRLFRCGSTAPESLENGAGGPNDRIANGTNSSRGGREPVVRVRGLTKDFGQLFGEKHRAVNKVDMDICANQITVLLGHNGAGKTTTMSIISGVIPKTSGEISVNGERDVNQYRKDIGYCPQHNVFLPYFTCMDHLVFFGVLRGLSNAEAREKSRALLDRLKLLPKANEYGKDLSGGMKRRLCLGIALIGDTKIAILDEPSSGLDPESRRELWNILIEMRKRNTIMITTHYMEEAETLADYISIMSRGEILCHGTAQQLKRRYADGYVLKLLTNERFETAQTMDRLRRHIPEAKVKSFVKPTLNVTLPYSHLDKYSEALAELERESQQLGIVSFGLSNASLEEVFLNSDPQKHAPEAQDSQSQSYDQVDGNSYSPLNEVKYKQNCNLWTQQVIAIFYKKAVYVRRHWIRLLVCVAILVAAVGFGLRDPNDSPSEHMAARLADELEISPQTMRNGAIMLHLDNAQSSGVKSFEAALRRQLDENNVRIVNVPSDGLLENSLLSYEKHNISSYHEHILFGLSIGQPATDERLSVRILYSGNVLHSTARGLNLVSNVLGRMQSAASGTPMQLRTISHPVQQRWHDLFVETTIRQSSGQTFSTYQLVMPMALFFYMLYYAFMPFAETNTEFKQLQIIPPALYWAAYYVFDVVQHLLVCALLYGLHIAFDRMHALTPCEHGQLIGLYAMYGAAYLPLMYVVAQVFASLSSVYSFFSYMFIGSTIPCFWFTLSFQTLHQYAGWISVLFVLPDYAVRHSINVFVLLHTQENIPKDDALVGMGRFYAYMAAVIVVMLVFLVLVLEHIYRRAAIVRVLRLYRPILRALRCGKRTSGVQEQPMLSTTPMEDVYGERDQTDAVVLANKEADYAIVVTKLRKMYDGFAAVRGVDFAVRRGECFGLLGMNGAGKTTTFKMMVRQLTITEGAIYFNGLNSRAQESRYRYQFGYCPQADALNGWMTAYETLKYMGLARGMRWAELNVEVRRLMQNTDLAAYADVTVQKMSGGTKRKLNTAVAIQSDPLLVFLDEPTTGVDPSSRRFMWACIQECQRQNKNIVLTSHSMDECEFLCNRLAIMNHGQLNCIGPIQQLKRSFGLGFLVTVQLRDGQAGTNGAAQLRQTVLDRFQCVLREEYGNQLTFLAQNTNILWSEVFRGMLAVQQQFDSVVEDISLSESSLEDIFLKIARDSHVDSPHAV